MSKPDLSLIYPQWPASKSVTAFCTTRYGGFSKGRYNSLNLASHVGDKLQDVNKNRRCLVESQRLPAEPEWLQQTHSTKVINLDKGSSRAGDAAITGKPGTIAVVLTADCMPVLFCNLDGSKVAAAHAGWRGLLNGVLEETVLQMNSQPQNILAWIGPAIGAAHYETGEDVRQVFIRQSADYEAFFRPNRPGHFLFDMYALARRRLHKLGINQIFGGDHCTYSDEPAFFSYRRDAETGRQASLIFINRKESPG